ncbi:L-threonylcarbamoyladenylate synthase [Rhodobacteraceae bacterium]|nr:L-threonylcarbamoyladenylate synthase [Paracoccaceae bacterium]
MHTQRLGSSQHDIEKAAEILAKGGLVAFPTETVFGLGADACDDLAVAKIYEAKGRPSFNPLIVHVSDVGMAKRLVEWNDQADQLAHAFWPGPLTLVLPMRTDAGVSKLVSAGLPTVAIRIPRHPIAQSMLRAFGGPVAAPSANLSGKISPTRADHVLNGLDGRIDAIITQGHSENGVESTILHFDPNPTILRPGTITAADISSVLGQPVARLEHADNIIAPGQMTSHYAPRAAVRLNAKDWHAGEKRLGFGNVTCDLNLSLTGDLVEAAANLFAMLHQIDDMDGDRIAVSPIPNHGIGIAINDRLSRAAAPRD